MKKALQDLLDFVVSGRRYETQNPHTIPEVRAAQAALGANSPIPEWAAEEIRKTWLLARDADGQTEAFRILERMVDRLGYGRVENNPPITKE